MADGVTSPVLNPKSVAWYNELYEVGRRDAADTRQKTTNRGVFFFSKFSFKLSPKHIPVQ
jgi:hypothetical protein